MIHGSKPRLRAQAAQIRLVAADARLKRDLAPARAAISRTRASWIVGGGLATGFALGLLSPRVWSRIGAAVGSIAAIVARSAIAPLITGAFIARERERQKPGEGES